MKKLFYSAISLFSLLMVVGCGGGGGGGTTTSSVGACTDLANCSLPSAVSAVPPQK